MEWWMIVYIGGSVITAGIIGARLEDWDYSNGRDMFVCGFGSLLWPILTVIVVLGLIAEVSRVCFTRC
jgi:hypothetical protein